MLDIVEIALKRSVTDEVYELVERSIDLFERMNFVGFEIPYEEIAALSDTVPPGYAEEQMVAVTRSMLLQLLQAHSVFFYEDAPFRILVGALEGLLQLPDFELKSHVISLIEAGVTPAETFAELMALVTEFQPEDFLLNLEEVNFALLNKVHSMMNESDDEDEEDITEQKRLRQVFKDMWEFFGSPEYPICGMVFSGLPLGLQYTLYANQFMDFYKTSAPSDIARMMLLMASISEEGSKVLVKPIAENIEMYIDDPHTVTKVDKALQDQFIAYSQHVEKRLISSRAQG